jgi:ribosomal protein S18 acetylase RimI-like enzyme
MNTTTLSIRTATPDDAMQMAQVHDEAWNYTYQGLLPSITLKHMIQKRNEKWWTDTLNRSKQYLALDYCQEVIGYTAFGNNRCKRLRFDGEIYELYLKPQYQGLGFGRHLFKVGVGELVRRKMHKVIVWSLEDNHAACSFYESMGGLLVARGVERIGNKDLAKIAYGWSYMP